MKTKSKLRRFIALTMCATLALTGCGSSTDSSEGSDDSSSGDEESTQVEATAFGDIDMSKWLYESDADVYYQVGLTYVSNPADTNYETMGIYVPGAYFTATDNGDDTYTCEINADGTVNGYTAVTAPIVIPVETPGYSAMAAPTGYTDVSAYTSKGLVYLYAGCRGRDAGAPAGVTDLKAAVRYFRSQSSSLPGNTEAIFSFGMSGGGAQSAVFGATGDSDLYTPYLEEIGAVDDESDAIAGSMCWCPITNLDSADEAYEWMMGTTRSDLSDEEQTISDGLADAYADYINALGLTDENGNELTLVSSQEGHMQAGSYYDYIVDVIENSLNNFLSDTTFPYDSDSSSSEGNGGMMGGGMGGRGGNIDFDNLSDEEKAEIEERMQNRGDGDMGTPPDGNFDGNADGGFPGGDAPDGQTADNGSADGDTQGDNITRNSSSQAAVSISGTYETAADYIAALNEPYTWVTYDESTNTATITSISDFAKAVKVSSKGIGAFDQLDASQGENTLFGYGDGQGAHFDSILAGLVTGTEYESAFTEDLAKTDSVGNTVDVRLNMYTPLYYLCPTQGGYQTSTVAKHWRIRTGAWQSDTSISTEANLALALENYSGVTDVDFETVWGAGHTTAERTGTSTDNFIEWVLTCAPA